MTRSSLATAPSAGPSPTAAADRGRTGPVLGRPASERHDRRRSGADLVVDASRATAVVRTSPGLAAGGRRFVIATTGWATDRARSSRLRELGAAAVVGQLQPRRRPSSGGSSSPRSGSSARSRTSTRTSSSGIGARRSTDRPAPRSTWPAGSSAGHPRLATRRRPRGRVGPRRRVARDAPGRLRRRRRDRRAPADRARSIGLRDRRPRRGRLARRATARARHPSIRPRRRRAPRIARRPRSPPEWTIPTRHIRPPERATRPPCHPTRSCAAPSRRSSPRSPPTAPSTNRPSAALSAGRSWPGSTASCRAARPARRPP